MQEVCGFHGQVAAATATRGKGRVALQVLDIKVKKELDESRRSSVRRNGEGDGRSTRQNHVQVEAKKFRWGFFF